MDFWMDLGASGDAFEAAVALLFGGRGLKKWSFWYLGPCASTSLLSEVFPDTILGALGGFLEPFQEHFNAFSIDF